MEARVSASRTCVVNAAALAISVMLAMRKYGHDSARYRAKASYEARSYRRAAEALLLCCGAMSAAARIGASSSAAFIEHIDVSLNDNARKYLGRRRNFWLAYIALALFCWRSIMYQHRRAETGARREMPSFRRIPCGVAAWRGGAACARMAAINARNEHAERPMGVIENDVWR